MHATLPRPFENLTHVQTLRHRHRRTPEKMKQHLRTLVKARLRKGNENPTHTPGEECALALFHSLGGEASAVEGLLASLNSC